MAGKPPTLSRISGGLSNASLVESSGVGLTVLMQQIRDELDEPVSPLRSANASFSVIRADKTLSFRFLELQNLPYPGSLTDFRVQCSNGFIRVHSLILFAASRYIAETFGKQISDGEVILEFPECDVHDMAKIVFVFYTGSTIGINARRSAIVRILKRFGCPEDRIVLTLPLKYSRSYEETNLRELEDMRVQIGNMNPGGMEESYFVSANGDRLGEDTSLNFMPNLSIQEPTGVRQSASFPMPRNSSREQAIPHITCGECPGGQNFLNVQDFNEHVQLTHGGHWYRDDPRIRVSSNQQRRHRHNADDITRRIPGGITPMVDRMSNRMEALGRLTSTVQAPNIDVNPPPDLEPQPSTSAAALRNLVSRKERGPSYYWYCPFCHRRSYLKALMTRHIIELHPRSDQGDEIASGPVQRPTNGTSEKYKCLICPENGENSFCSASVAGLELHSSKTHGLVRLKHYLILPRPKCLPCGKHHPKTFDKSESFFKHVHACLQTKLRKTNGNWKAVAPPSAVPLSKNADKQLWYNKLYLETLSPNCEPAYLGKLETLGTNQEPPLIELDATPSPVYSPVVASPPPPAAVVVPDAADTEIRVPIPEQVPERRSKRREQRTARSNKENVPNKQKKNKDSKGFSQQNLVASSPIQNKKRRVGRPAVNPKEKKKSKLENQNLNRETVVVEVANTPTESPRNDHDNTEMPRGLLLDHNGNPNPNHDLNQDVEMERNNKPLYKRIVRVSNSNDSEDGQGGRPRPGDHWVVDETSTVPETPEVQTTPENSERTLLNPVPREGIQNSVEDEEEFLSASDVMFENVEEPGLLLNNNNSHSPAPLALPHQTESTNTNENNSPEFLITNRLPQDP